MTATQHVAQERPRLQHSDHRQSQLFGWIRFLFKRVSLHTLVYANIALSAFASCTAPKNQIEAENCLPGNPLADWYVDGVGSPNIAGFATDISVNVGQTVFFKIATNALDYRIDIYRLGYYQGNGARQIASVSPTVSLPQVQPACLTDGSTGLTDCGNWGISASWTVPDTATSGVYFAKLVRLDTGEASPVVFIVRNDSGHSDVLVQTSDPTWYAYNDYGGSSLYAGPTIRAFKVSYNRPLHVYGYTWLFSAEYPMLRWLEANGYDLSYFTGVDSDRYGTLITQHKIFMSVGHDEYWSGGQRANVEAARAVGVNLAFFSGNEIAWKTRWEPSIDGTNTSYRTLVCYKESLANAVIDPQDPPTWTGAWRDQRFSPPADGGRPENALSGTISRVNATRNDSITVPQADGRMRFWRNTAIAALAPGQVATLPAGTLGYEWDVDDDNGFRPAGLVPLSTTTLTVPSYFQNDYTYASGTATHHLTMYRALGGALVFGAGTVQWSWGLEATHTISGTPTDLNMQQATVNLLADMGVQPVTLQSGLLPATPSTDTIPPSSAIIPPAPGSTVTAGSPVTISGNAADSGGGVVGAVEISLDAGKTWHPAVGRENWSYDATFRNTGNLNVRSRAVDDSGNLEVPSPGITVTVGPPPCPCTVWPSTAVPFIVDAGPYSSLELGVQFWADSSGYITGIRFYKSASNTGVHVGNLWSSSGTLLATATFTGETASGWQQVNFSNPVAITANTLYVASYHTSMGHFSADQNYFATSGVDNAPLHVPANGGANANGVYAFASTSAFPTNTYNSMNFWVDVVFNFNVGSTLPLSVSTTSLPNGTQSAPYNQSLAAVGGTTPYTWSLSSGTLPSGLTLSTSGQISGTPTTVGTSNFTAQVTDSGAPAQTATQALSIIIGPIVSSLALNPTSVVGGVQSSTGTVTLSGPAPAGDAQVLLSSSNTALASVPSSVTVPAGATSVTFTVTTSAVAASTSVTISASYGGVSKTAALTVTPSAPPPLSSLALNPASVVGGAQSSRGTVTLSGPAPAGGAQVTLSSSNTAVANVPSSVTVPAGATSANFTVTTSAVAASTPVTISASYGGVSRTASLTVTPSPPPPLSSLALNPTSVIGGAQSSTGTVTLSGPAPAGGAQVTLSSSNTAVASVPSSVTVPAGATSATFAVTTSAVAASTPVTISASYGGVSKAASLTVTPPPAPTLSSLALNPTSVIGGLQSSTGTVTLSGPAPAGGAQVTLSSSNTAVASVPSSVTVPAGAISATFTVHTSLVLISTSVNISASSNGTTRTASLGVNF